jgi:hypothetical protein
MTTLPEPLPAEALRWKFKPEESLAMDGDELSTDTFIGQERAERALAFGLRMRPAEFNLYVAGPSGTGKYTMCKSYCQRVAEEFAVPESTVFVHNFSDPDKPVWLKFPPGVERAFRNDMEALIAELQEFIPKAFEDEAHEERRKELVEGAQAGQREKLAALENRAKETGFTVQMSATGLNVTPMIDGKPATTETFESLPVEERDNIEKKRLGLGEHIGVFVRRPGRSKRESANGCGNSTKRSPSRR